ncbi:uncharacterized protein [Diabrotica undecimpunctata]|uniref:uncharacterized protein n=1 Tax=Diabrotica undecimpunctata TaxID=50387 RepID=UPI003B641A56
MSSSRVKKWSSQDIIKFLEVYEQHTCLWDIRSNRYKDRNSRMDAYKNIATTMAIDGFQADNVKAKIRSLRNAYTLELAKILKSKKFGAGADDIYKPKVPWFPVADRILHGVVQIRDTQLTEFDVADFETQSTINDIEETTRYTLVEITPPTVLPGVISEAIPTTSKGTFITNKKTAEPARKKAKTSARNFQSSKKRTILEPRKISASLRGTKARVEENEFDVFGKSVACHLKKLPEFSALESMQHIQSYLIQRRMENTLQTSRPDSAASTPTAMEYSSNNSYSDTDILSQVVEPIIGSENEHKNFDI